MKRVATHIPSNIFAIPVDRLLSLILLLLAPCVPVKAATICVQANDVVGLKDALVTAAHNGEDDVVRLQSGHYYMPQNFFLYYYSATEQYDLTIEGGYGEFFGDPCGLVPTTPDPRVTVLDGGQLFIGMTEGNGSIALRSITVSNMSGTAQNGGMAVQIGVLGNNSTGSISVYNSMFIGNTSVSTNAIFLVPAGGPLLIQNSVFASNSSWGGKSPMYFSAGGPGALCVAIVNSTFTGNFSSVAAVELYVPSCGALAANDILWGNPSGDIEIHFPDTTYLVNDDLGNLGEAANTQSSNLLSTNPMFNSDFSLCDASPLRDAGGDGSFIFSPGKFDVVGNPRVYGTHPDVGAYEIQDVIFANGVD